MIATALGAALPACRGDDGATPLTHEQLLDAEACESCHPQHFRAWSGSSHAYAADDPVFLAANARYQRERGDQPADACVRCHAPVALAEGATTDGLNLGDLPASLRGVTCYACHAVSDASAVRHTLTFADEDVVFGGIEKPTGTGAHAQRYDALFDRNVWRSTDLCGSCHEFDNAYGAQPHRTYREWSETIFANQQSALFLSCGGCHTEGQQGQAAVDGPTRLVHDHRFIGLDVALLPWPEKETQLAGIEADLDPTIFARVCLTSLARPEVTLDNVMGGHSFPSGAAYTRRMWVEVVARKGDTVLYESGRLADDEALLPTLGDDPYLWVIRDKLLDGDGQEVLFEWQARELESSTLGGSVTTDLTDPAYYHSVTRTYPALPDVPDTITMKVHIRPIGLDIIDELVASGDLDAAVRDRIPTFTPESAVIEWTGAQGDCVPPL